MWDYFTHPRLKNILLLTVIVVAFGSLAFSVLEDWEFLDSLYFTIATMTTVGYGDFVPTHDASKLLAVIYMVISVPLILFSIGLVAEVAHDKMREGDKKKKRK